MLAILDAKKPKRAAASLRKPKGTRLYLEGGAVRAVERHADKAVILERLEQVADVCGAVRVRTAGDFVMELFRCMGEKLAVARFRDEDVDVLVFEGCTACKEVLVP